MMTGRKEEKKKIASFKTGETKTPNGLPHAAWERKRKAENIKKGRSFPSPREKAAKRNLKAWRLQIKGESKRGGKRLGCNGTTKVQEKVTVLIQGEKKFAVGKGNRRGPFSSCRQPKWGTELEKRRLPQKEDISRDRKKKKG